MNILFYDAFAPYSYTTETLAHRGIGGTETCVLRIAHQLANTYGHTVYVAQKQRSFWKGFIINNSSK